MIPKEMIKFAEGVMRLKTVVDDTATLEAKAAQARAAHETALASYAKELDECLAKIQHAHTLHDQAVADLDKHQRAYADAKAQLDRDYADAKAKHDKQLAALHTQAQSTLQSLTYEKAAALKAVQDAKTLHAAEMAAMGAERAKLEGDLTKLREVRHKLLSQLQTGV